MGYYTQYSLVVEADNNMPLTIIADFRNTCESAKYALNQYGECPGDGTKWYSHETDVENISLKYPKALFILSGIGEEYPDYWKMYVKNGKSFRTKGVVTYEPYNESKLS